MSFHPEFTYAADPKRTAAINRKIERESRLRIASIKRRKDPRPLIARLADDMLEIAGSGQTVDRTALRLRGYTSIELSDSNLARAQDVANAKAVRQVA